MIAGARPGLRLSYRGYTVIPDAMRVKGEDMQERRGINGNPPSPRLRRAGGTRGAVGEGHAKGKRSDLGRSPRLVSLSYQHHAARHTRAGPYHRG